jgi:hypothetical protein
LLGREAGDTVDGFTALLVGGEFGGIAFYTENLADVRESQILVELAAGPDVTDFQPPVGLIDGGVLRGEKRSD